MNSGHLDLRVPRKLETGEFGHKLLITNNEFWEKKVQKISKEKIFMSSQTFFNLTNKIKIIPVINYFRIKGNKIFFSFRKRREINNRNAVKFFNKENINIMNFGHDLDLKSQSIFKQIMSLIFIQ